MRERMWIIGAAVSLAAGWAAGGCTAPQPRLVVTHPDPSVKIPAMKKAVRKKDRAAVRQLVKDLESDDPAVRFYAIGALERITGRTFDYQYFDPEERRGPAVRRWHEWLDGKEQPKVTGGAEPATQAATDP